MAGETPDWAALVRDQCNAAIVVLRYAGEYGTSRETPIWVAEAKSTQQELDAALARLLLAAREEIAALFIEWQRLYDTLIYEEAKSPADELEAKIVAIASAAELGPVREE